MKKQNDFVVRRRIHNGKKLLSIPKTQRNDPCHCGSKKKYKSCCLPKDEIEFGISAEERAKAIEEAIKKEQEEK